MRKLFLCLLCAFAFSHDTYTQQRHCGADEYLAERLANDLEFNKLFSTYQKDRTSSLTEAPLQCDTSNTVVIPVAVHYNFPVNCSNLDCLRDAALAQIQVLNEDYGAANADLTQYTSGLNGICPSAYPLSRAPITNDGSCIQFKLASKNHPTGYNLSNGDPAITIGINAWPSAGPDWAGYLNIFVSDANTAGQTNSTLGISALPGNADGDGLWISYRSFGGPGFNCTSGVLFNSNNTYNLGRTGTHEVGHYLGLYHVFQGSSCGDNDSNPPGPIDVNDTPAQSNPHYGCPSVTNCSNVPAACTGSTDNFYSFMDYSNDDCMVMFTSDQCKVINHWGNFLNFIPDSLVCDNTPLNTALCNGPTCGDGIQNGNEIGIDCGGTYCGPCNFYCGDTFLDSGGTANYYPNEDVSWTICTSVGNVVQLTFSSFDVESGGPSGCYDKLRVYDGNSVNSTLLGTYCGDDLSDAPGGGSLSSTATCMTLNFTSDNSGNKPGWEAIISCNAGPTCGDGIQNGDETGIDCGGSCPSCVISCGELLTDSGGQSSTYSSSEQSEYLLCPSTSNEKIVVDFTHVDIEAANSGGTNGTGCWDFLEIYDGPDESSTLLGTYCGEFSGDGNIPSIPSNYLTPGMSFQSSHSSGCLFMKFNSDLSVNETGWEANVNCQLNSVVPVNLISFEAANRDKSVLLTWTTEEEINNAGFHIEKSLDGVNFNRIAWKTALVSAAQIKKYNFLDDQVGPGQQLYYRLVQEDKDGQLDFSAIRSIKTISTQLGRLQVYPNPTSDMIQLSIDLENEHLVSLSIFSKMGALLLTEQLDGSQSLRTMISLKDYTSGVYLVRLETNRSTIVRRITKN